jgi:hypothetical protein
MDMTTEELVAAWEPIRQIVAEAWKAIEGWIRQIVQAITRWVRSLPPDVRRTIGLPVDRHDRRRWRLRRALDSEV